MCWRKVGGEPLHGMAKMLCAEGLETYKEEPMCWRKVGGEPLNRMAKKSCVYGLGKWKEESGGGQGYERGRNCYGGSGESTVTTEQEPLWRRTGGGKG